METLGRILFGSVVRTVIRRGAAKRRLVPLPAESSEDFESSPALREILGPYVSAVSLAVYAPLLSDELTTAALLIQKIATTIPEVPQGKLPDLQPWTENVTILRGRLLKASSAIEKFKPQESDLLALHWASTVFSRYLIGAINNFLWMLAAMKNGDNGKAGECAVWSAEWEAKMEAFAPRVVEAYETLLAKNQSLVMKIGLDRETMAPFSWGKMDHLRHLIIMLEMG